MSKYDVEKYIKSVLNLDRTEIVQQIQGLWRSVENRSFGNKGAVAARNQGSLAYVAMLKHLLFLLQTEQRPLGIEDSVFSKFRPLCEKLVEKGQMRGVVVELFEK